jgi:hypothetical protein
MAAWSAHAIPSKTSPMPKAIKQYRDDLTDQTEQGTKRVPRTSSLKENRKLLPEVSSTSWRVLAKRKTPSS